MLNINFYFISYLLHVSKLILHGSIKGNGKVLRVVQASSNSHLTVCTYLCGRILTPTTVTIVPYECVKWVPIVWLDNSYVYMSKRGKVPAWSHGQCFILDTLGFYWLWMAFLLNFIQLKRTHRGYIILYIFCFRCINEYVLCVASF